MKKTVLVTGGLGYIGSHTVVSLIESGFEVLIIDDLSNSEASVLSRIKEICGVEPVFECFDLCDKVRLNNFFDKHKVDAIIHFAAFKAVGESVREPLRYYRNNLVTLINLLEVMKTYDISNFVFSSSCTVYGEPDSLPVNEEAPIKKAGSPYGNTKQIAEDIIVDTSKANDKLKAIALRYFNPIGAHESALIGEMPIGVPNSLVPYITQTAIGVREVLTVHGDDYDTPDGSCIRDYIHVVDLAQAHVKALGRMLEGKSEAPVEYFNIGTGQGYSVKELIEEFEKVNGLKLSYRFGPRREGDIVAVYADPTKAKDELGWVAERGLKEMLSSAWEWEKYYRQNLGQKS